MKLLPASPRKRRRLAKIGVVVLFVIVVAVLTAIFKPPSGDSGPSTAPARGSVYVEERPVKLTPAMRREINATLERFIPAAVLRRDTETAYELSTPSLRAGASRDEWERGEIPVFPASVRPPYNGWRLNWSVKDNVNFDLMLNTTQSEKAVAAYSYNVDLKRLDGEWRVESFFPVAQFRRTSLENGTKVVASYDFVPVNYQGASRTREEEKRIFTLALFSIPALGLALVLALFAAQFVRNRRAERRYAAERATS